MVFNGTGQRETQLADTASALVASFEALLARLVETRLDGSRGGAAPGAGDVPELSLSPLAAGVLQHRAEMRERSHHHSSSGVSRGGGSLLSPAVSTPCSVAGLLVQFDQAWVQFLDQFVAWKTEDSQALESEMVRHLLFKCLGGIYSLHILCSFTQVPRLFTRLWCQIGMAVKMERSLRRKLAPLPSGSPIKARALDDLKVGITTV